MAISEHVAGGKISRRLPEHVRGSAVFGGDTKEYRYRLKRVWDPKLPTILFIMMNPSTADPESDDPTVARCRNFAVAWKFGTLLVGNTFAYRVTDQKQLLSVSDPVGPENDLHLVEMAHAADLVVFAYGQPHKTLRYRGPAVARLLQESCSKPAHMLRLSKDGTPCHPLYLPGTLRAKLWLISAEEEIQPRSGD